MLSVKNVDFCYNNSITLSNISLNVQAGEYLAVVGESGSGKSTLLKLIYGEFDVNNGSISWGSTPILGPKDKLIVGHNFMKYVAQEFDLMPFTTVGENIGTHLSNFFPKEKEKRIQELLAVVELEKYQSTKVKHLSGGQKQRVALAKALAKQPEILLLDEPFSHIDNFKKQSLRKNLFHFLKAKNIACIVATHDKNDVLAFADNMIVLNHGKILLEGFPKDLYLNPKNPLLAAFFSEYCIIDGTIFYAHQIKVSEKGTIRAEVRDCYFQGTHFLIEAETDDEIICFNHPSSIKTKECVLLLAKKDI
ncbi:MAG: ABC transporter ATP-binding protein [Flavobacteriaceae bacterium]